VLGARERARENHLASPWARLKRDVKFALRERFGGDKTVFQTDLPQPRCHAAIVCCTQR
jgi:hypothetical protein